MNYRATTHNQAQANIFGIILSLRWRLDSTTKPCDGILIEQTKILIRKRIPSETIVVSIQAFRVLSGLP